MTNSSNALALRAAPQHAMDIESQQTEAPQYNRNLARAKIATLAVASLAGAFTSAVIALHEGSSPASGHDGRTLLENDCSQNQLNNIKNAKRALIISGATTGACFGGVFLGGALMGGCMAVSDSAEGGAADAAGIAGTGIGGCIGILGALGMALGASATLVSGIVYGVSKNNC